MKFSSRFCCGMVWLLIASFACYTSQASASPQNGLVELGKVIRSKPVVVLTNTPLTGRLKSLVDEMNLEDYSDRDLITGQFASTEFAKSNILILIDREAGSLPFELESIAPDFVRRANMSSGDVSSLAAMQIVKRPQHKSTVFVTAPNRECLIKFLNDELRDAKKIRDFKDTVKTKRMEVLPSPPTIIFPKGKVNSTRPPVFFVARRNDLLLTYTVQVQPRGQEKEPRKEDLGSDSTAGEVGDGWVDFNARVLVATRYEMDAWGVKEPKDEKRRGLVTYVYNPDFDVVAGRDYTIRIRASVSDLDEGRPGAWSSADEVVSYTVPPQPENLEVSTRITHAETYDAFNPAYSPDGKYVLYATNKANRDIWEIFADDATAPGTGSIKVTASNRGSRDIEPSWGPSLGPNVASLAFARIDRLRTGGVYRRSLWQVAMGTSSDAAVPAGMTRITEGSDDSFSPAFSMDGKKLAYCVTSGRGDTEIWVNEAGSGPRVLISGVDPAWDKDGLTLYYSSNEGGSWDIWKINTSTGRKTQLTTDEGNEFGPRPNPKGNGEVVYTGTSTGNFDVYILKGGRSVRLTEWLGNDVCPTWSPDGKHIVYCTTRFSGNRRYDIAVLDPSSK